MQRFAYGLFLLISRLITLLPYRAMFLFADLLYVVLYYIIGYRKKVVLKNLRNAFPEKPAGELHKIRKKFFRHLSDLFIETMAMYYASPEDMNKRLKVINPEKFIAIQEKHHQVIFVLGHLNNWEYILGVAKSYSVNASVAYKPLSNKYFNAFYQKLRSRFGAIPFPMMQTLRVMLQDKKHPAHRFYALVADQRPTNRESHIWARFLNQPTKVFFGPEKLARKLQLPVVYVDIKKLSRGHYSIEAKTITENPAEMEHYAITREYLKQLTQSIREQPAYWLWSHKRWKKHPPYEGELLFEV